MRTLRDIAPRQTWRRPREIELDDLGRAGADQEQELDVGAALDQAGDDPVELLVGVDKPARSRSSMIAVAKRGSAKIITPAAD